MVSGVIKVDALLEKMTLELQNYLKAKQIDNPMIIGIRTGGVWVAEALQKSLELDSPMGVLDIAFYRDDFTRMGLHPKVQPSILPTATEGRHIILVDDVLMSGRTVRAAMNEIFDYGRPASITLATLIDLNRRELPVQADVIGEVMLLDAGERVKLTGPQPLSIEISKRAD
ncbi:bifunctional pyr operon transcriptional regulator/uracil phosphoribosyltransferase PyrR [Aliamphritea ceti]|uniref:bifunctional pyr operon transcriptional regulator/uracil phosphoribosyltransferase PyrR n=1 Tax=Aliamphritea ceti TaxID=1524258 RepID=UPI0021C444DA|nr:bifunctional pyr operon transcriptional regulator/uracil phosphoribosyltransferase PyrR [Aliamphritea ceti]